MGLELVTELGEAGVSELLEVVEVPADVAGDGEEASPILGRRLRPGGVVAEPTDGAPCEADGVLCERPEVDEQLNDAAAPSDGGGGGAHSGTGTVSRAALIAA